MKNIANADRPKSAAAMLPPRPFRGSGKVAQTACNSDRREGKSCIPTLNQTFADSRILKISKFPTFRIAVTTHIGSDRFAVFRTGPSKSRLAFLRNLLGGAARYVINEAALVYMRDNHLPQAALDKLAGCAARVFPSDQAWMRR